MLKTTAIMRGTVLYTIVPWPQHVENPYRWRWLVYRDGVRVGVVHRKQDAIDRINSGMWEPREERQP